VIIEKVYDKEVKLDKIVNSSDNNEKLDSNLIKILKTMKPLEHCTCHIKYPAFETLSNNPLILQPITKLITCSNLEKEKSFIDVEVKN